MKRSLMALAIAAGLLSACQASSDVPETPEGDETEQSDDEGGLY